MSASTTEAPVAAAATAGSGSGMRASTLAVTGRTIRKFVRTPQLIVVGTVQGAMFLLIFRYVFGGAIDAGDIDYVDFLVPGFIVTSVLFTGMGAATGMAEDIEAGFLDRLRSLPIPRLSVVAGRALADTALLTWNLAVTTGIGFAVGFRVHGDAMSALAAFGLCIVFGFAFDWLFISLGLLARNPQAAQGMSMLVFPLTFVSSAYVPIETMPSFLRAFAEHQPITTMVDAARSLVLGSSATAQLGHSASYFVTRSLIWSAALVVGFAPLAAKLYNKE